MVGIVWTLERSVTLTDIYNSFCVCVYFVHWLGTAYCVLNDVHYAALMDIHFILEIL